MCTHNSKIKGKLGLKLKKDNYKKKKKIRFKQRRGRWDLGKVETNKPKAK